MKNKRERTAALRALRLAQRMSSLEEMASYGALPTRNLITLLTYYCGDKGLLLPYSGLPQVVIHDAPKSLKIYRAENRSLNLRQTQRARNAFGDTQVSFTCSLWENSHFRRNFIWRPLYSDFAEMRLMALHLLKDWLILKKDIEAIVVPDDSHLPKTTFITFTTESTPATITAGGPLAHL